MRPKPPSNVEAHSSNEPEYHSRSIGKWSRIVYVFSFIGLVVWVTPFVRDQRRKAIQTSAQNSAIGLGLALSEFASEYGKLPDANTIADVKGKTGSVLSLGTKTSNDFFRQLIAAEGVRNEIIFYAEIAGTHKPDNRIDAAHALEKGECGFAYVMGGDSKSYNRPLAMTPMIPGTDRFDPKPFGGKAVVLRMDNSVSSLAIDKDGRVIINGMNLMDPHHPIWDGHAPVIAWPDF
jgi:hypothetical protein